MATPTPHLGTVLARLSCFEDSPLGFVLLPSHALGVHAHQHVNGVTLRVPIIHPCWSGGMLVLVESAAEPVLSSDVQARDPLGIGDRVG
jgi:hypothetical protein